MENTSQNSAGPRRARSFPKNALFGVRPRRLRTLVFRFLNELCILIVGRLLATMSSFKIVTANVRLSLFQSSFMTTKFRNGRLNCK